MQAFKQFSVLVIIDRFKLNKKKIGRIYRLLGENSSILRVVNNIIWQQQRFYNSQSIQVPYKVAKRQTV